VTSYEISSTGVNLAIDDMMEATAAIENVVNNLEQSCAATLGTWVGEAQSMYTSAMAQWDTATREMRDLLVGASRTLGSVHEGYVTAERTIASNWDDFRM
jgi:WXG100 family type VII secretion target